MLYLTYEEDAGAWKMPLSRHELHALFASMQAATGLDAYDVELTICNDASIAHVNAEYLGCDGPTNILSFPQSDGVIFGDDGDEGDEGDGEVIFDTENEENKTHPVLGALLLSVDTLLREAFLYGQDEREHCIRLLAHGLGHIAGYDHGPEMEEFEECAKNTIF
ncbi:MAG: rRNA maturation RNase YbeY [Pseudomonadota bacterium]